MSGVVDELICLDIPVERRLPSGFMILYYEKAVLESVYKHSHVVHEGQLRIIFTRELKVNLFLSYSAYDYFHLCMSPRDFFVE